jgi:uncharacterized heparinase superfamily protein
MCTGCVSAGASVGLGELGVTQSVAAETSTQTDCPTDTVAVVGKTTRGLGSDLDRSILGDGAHAATTAQLTATRIVRRVPTVRATMPLVSGSMPPSAIGRSSVAG